MPKTLPEIKAAWWSPKLGAFGEVTESGNDINQAIAIILTTPKGTDPHRPDFAIDWTSWIDQPLNVFTPNLIREVYSAVLRWEPRVELTKVTVNAPYTEIQRALVQIDWTLKDSTVEGAIEVEI